MAEKAIRSVQNKCIECGKEYYSKMHRPGYCSASCKRAAQKKRDQAGKTKHIVRSRDGEERECPICGKTYHVTPYFISKGWKQFCSKECQLKSKSTLYKCERCGKIVAGLKSTPQRFCSRKCVYEWLSELNTKKKEIRVCKWCGKDFEMWPLGSKGKSGETKEGQYCSRDCRFAHMRDVHWFDVNGEIVRIGSRCKVYFKKCKECGKKFTTKLSLKLYCSDECKNTVTLKKIRASYWGNKPPLEAFECEECGKLVTPKYGNRGKTKFCSTKCMNRYQKRIRGNTHRKRARHFGCEYKPVDPLRVFDRDGWRCQICGKKLRACNRGTNKDNAPELDHIIPLSQGGDHSYLNTQCSCRKCNIEKSNNIYGQLRMFG